MRPDAFRAALIAGNVDQRMAIVRSLTDPEVIALTPSLFALLITDSSLQVRRAAEETLARRPTALIQDRPAPLGSFSKDKVADVAADFIDDANFVAMLLCTDPGQSLLVRLSMKRAAVDNALLHVAETVDSLLIPQIVALPIDLTGRARRLIEKLPEFDHRRREGLLHALVWSALCDTGITPLGEDSERAKTSFALWVDGLLATLASTAAPPSYTEFLAAGARLRAGPTERLAEAPSPGAITALAPLERLVTLALVSSRTPLLDRSSLADDLAHEQADLKVMAWATLARNALVEHEELLSVALSDARPGVVVELLEQLKSLGPLPPELVSQLRPTLDHSRASVRLSATRVLADSEIAAAIACATVDPRSEGAPLTLLAAQPEYLADPALTAYLDTPRSAHNTAHALASLRRPPAPTWAQWRELLANPSTNVRTAARAALLRLPAQEGPSVSVFLPRLLADAPLDAVRLIERFKLSGHHAELADLLLSESIAEDVALAAIRVLRASDSPSTWTTLWSFVVDNDPKLESRGTRRSRAAALEGVLAIAPPKPTETSSNTEPRAKLARLLGDRDPVAIGLALRYLRHHPTAATGELLDTIYDLLLATLDQARRPRRSRARRAALRRGLRAVLPRSWVAPRSSPRGREARLLTTLLEAALELDVRGIWPDEIVPALNHAAPAVRRAAVRLTLKLRHGPLDPFVSSLSREGAREAIAAAPQAEAEALITARLSAACRGDRRALAQAREWLEARPIPAALPYLERLLALPATREHAVASLVAIHSTPRGAAPAAAIARAEVSRALTNGNSEGLRPVADLLQTLKLWDDVPTLLPALAWASESARKRLVELLRRARAEHVDLDANALRPLLEHPLVEVRVLALSLLRGREAEFPTADLWSTIRAHGVGWPRPLPTDFAKPLLGVCEDHYEDSMGLALEGLLQHPNGEVARRALKLINRNEREISSLALFENLEDPELRQATLTTFSTWSARFLDSDLSAELLEDARRKVRASIAGLVEGTHVTRVGDAVRATLIEGATTESQVPYVQAAALYAIGHLNLGEFAPRVLSALEGDDPLLQRCAAWAAGELGPELDMNPVLTRLSRSKSPELRAAARSALVLRLDPEQQGAFEGLLADPSPAVRLRLLAVLRARPEVLALVTLEAHLSDPDPRMREQILCALTDRKTGSAAALRGALADPQPEVRLAALAVVAAWNALDELRHEVGERLADPSIHVSGAALELLGPCDPTPEPEDESESESSSSTQTQSDQDPEAQSSSSDSEPDSGSEEDA
jgi:hypothetical protein